ncbi:MAG: hypothetical protein WD009_10195 [Phycisphaeraceae bacterium]
MPDLILNLAQSEPFWRSLMPLIGIVLILVSVVMIGRRRLAARRERDRAAPTPVRAAAVDARGGGGGGTRERLAQAREKHAMRGDLDQVMVEIEQFAKRFGSQLDAKTIKLERLVRQADARIEQLRRLSDAGTGEPSADDPAPPTPDAAAGRLDMDWSPGAESSADAAAPDEDALRRNVYDLADQGLAAGQIARRLDEHVGKIELVLALRRA